MLCSASTDILLVLEKFKGTVHVDTDSFMCVTVHAQSYNSTNMPSRVIGHMNSLRLISNIRPAN